MVRALAVELLIREQAETFFGGGLRGEAWANGLAVGPHGLEPRFDAPVLVAMLRQALASDRWDEWEAVRCPVLVVRACDAGFQREDMQEVARRARHGSYAEVAEAGHDLHLEAAVTWRAAIECFLACDGKDGVANG